MLGIYEKRHFADGEKIWLGRYWNLTNVLHWHFECELIRVISGRVQVRIGSFCFEAEAGDCFFCAGEELHSIIGEPDAVVDIAIIEESLSKDITNRYMLVSPKLPGSIPVDEAFGRIRKERAQKGPLYREALAVYARGLLIDIFHNCPLTRRGERGTLWYKNLIRKINRDFSFITFEDAVRDCGYSASHFSKMFKKLSGMNFSEYLNLIKVEHAIILLQSNDNATVTSVCAKCGFSTVRNFNRVFKSITGHTPRSLPEDFIIDTGLHITKGDRFDPTGKTAVLM